MAAASKAASRERLPERARNTSEEVRLRVDEGGEEIFRGTGVEGAFAWRSLGSDETVVVNPRLATARQAPWSTFKIANTLIGLEVGVIPNEHFSLRWDGKPREIAEWNHDQDLASAMKYSVVWFYQEVARRIGPERMRSSLRAFQYGNADASGKIDGFWLGDTLSISPVEQVDFLSRLWRYDLPVKKAHVDTLKKLIEIEKGPGYVWYGKTGTGPAGNGRHQAWLVGAVEGKGGPAVYASFISVQHSDSDSLGALRRDLTRKQLIRAGFLPDR